jgi:hypothetical protein
LRRENKASHHDLAKIFKLTGEQNYWKAGAKACPLVPARLASGATGFTASL